VQIHETSPPEVASSTREDRRTCISSAAYDRALERFGGRRTEARASVHCGELLVALYESPPYALKVPPMDSGRLSINLTDVPVFGGIAFARSRTYQGRRYSLFYTPAASDAHWSTAGHSRHLNIYFKESLIEELADGHTALLNRERPLLDIHVRCITPWIKALEHSMGEPGLIAADASVSLAHLIIAKLACLPGRRAPTLKAAALARVRDYVGENLAETIGVADLAALTGLSVGRFALCFRASTGVTPHRFVVNRRVEAAISLLRERSLPMVEIAVSCGFSSQQHMATIMRRVARVAPSTVRGWSVANRPEIHSASARAASSLRMGGEMARSCK
jgi:AraC family transcriptional regulator